MNESRTSLSSCGPMEICPGLASNSWLVFCTASPPNLSLGLEAEKSLDQVTPRHEASQRRSSAHSAAARHTFQAIQPKILLQLQRHAPRHTRSWSSSTASAVDNWIGPTGTGLPLPSSMRIRIFPRRILGALNARLRALKALELLEV